MLCWAPLKPPKNGKPHTNRAAAVPSCGLERVQLEDVVIGGRGEEELLLRAARAVVAGAVQALQRPLKVQQLAHEVEVGRDVGLLALDEVVGVVE